MWRTYIFSNLESYHHLLKITGIRLNNQSLLKNIIGMSNSGKIDTIESEEKDDKKTSVAMGEDGVPKSTGAIKKTVNPIKNTVNKKDKTTKKSSWREKEWKWFKCKKCYWYTPRGSGWGEKNERDIWSTERQFP